MYKIILFIKEIIFYVFVLFVASLFCKECLSERPSYPNICLFIFTPFSYMSFLVLRCKIFARCGRLTQWWSCRLLMKCCWLCEVLTYSFGMYWLNVSVFHCLLYMFCPGLCLEQTPTLCWLQDRRDSPIVSILLLYMCWIFLEAHLLPPGSPRA